MDNIKLGDLVNIHFSDGHTQEGIVREVPDGSSVYYRVETKVWDKTTNIYCTRDQIDLIEIERPFK